jgi:EAL domain-containing protein (putative c-di-GMP-specific phosphodiesterase class I)
MLRFGFTPGECGVKCHQTESKQTLGSPYGLSASNLVFEITEGLLMQKDSHVTEQLMALQNVGIEIALDDFGQGFYFAKPMPADQFLKFL